MKEENENLECVAIYDVRGIQNYIFKTNALKEIVGASAIVDNLIIDEFRKAVEESNIPEEEYLLNWEQYENLAFEIDNKIKLEVLYYGGGNLVVLFRDEYLCKEISQRMSKNIMKKAYGLSLAYAYVFKTEDYQNDWKNLKDTLGKIKATTPLNKPIGILPIVQYDNVTGTPLSKIVHENNRVKKVTFEAFQKIEKYNHIPTENEYMKEFDKMRATEDESLIAVVHIDGNSMGLNIGSIMKDATTYDKSTSIMREISKNIHETFEEKALKRVKGELESICFKHGIKYKKNNLPFRPIIKAGDDITFVCNARISLDIVRIYIDEIRKGYMYHNQYKFSACAGIAIIHSHFPFHKAYQIAENCCEKAKERAKTDNYKINDEIGNFVDLHYCYSGYISDDLDEMRAHHYQNIENRNLICRPFGIYTEDEKRNLTKKQQECDLDVFLNNLDYISSVSRSTAKNLRDSYYKSKANMISLLKMLKKKNQDFPLDVQPYYDDGVAKYYDALEFLDIFAKKEGENNEI